MKKLLLIAACWAACPAAFAVTCTPPTSGDWTLGADCTYTSCGYRVAGNVNVGNFTLTLNPSASACVMGVDLSAKTVSFGASGRVMMSGSQKVQATAGANHTYHWSYGSWSSCPCGVSKTHTRTVTCLSDWDNQPAPAALCTGAMPPSSESCWAGYCSWAQSGFGGCSASCGPGNKTQGVWCTGGAVADCDAGARPVDTIPCNNGACCTWQYVTDWGPSSQSSASASNPGSDLSHPVYKDGGTYRKYSRATVIWASGAPGFRNFDFDGQSMGSWGNDFVSGPYRFSLGGLLKGPGACWAGVTSGSCFIYDIRREVWVCV